MANNRPKVELQLNQPIRLKIIRNEPLIGENGHGKYCMYAVTNEAGEELVWFAPAPAHEVIQSQQLKAGSEIIVKPTGKNKVEVSILGKAAEPEQATKSSDSRKEVMIQSMRDAADILAAVPDLGFRAEDARAIGLSLFIART